MYNFLTFIIVMLISIQASFAQIGGLGNIYQTVQSLSSNSDKELKILRKELTAKVKENKNKSEENLQELRKRGYSFHIWSGVTDNNLKMLLAMDDKLVTMQSEIDSKIRNLKNADLINDMATPVKHTEYYGSTEDIDYTFLDTRNELISRHSKLREQYSKWTMPGSSETNSWYLQQISTFNKPDDDEKLKLLEQSLAIRKQLYAQRDKVLAEYKRKQEESERQRKAELLAEQEEKRIEQERLQEIQRKREEEIAALPSKAEIKAKFRTYKHKTGHVFELFPAGFTPKPNKSTYDKIQIRGRVFTARYREYNDYGINSLVIEFYDSGKISNVTVFNGADPIYMAEYKDGSSKPYEIRTKTPDKKFQITFKRTYDMYEDKVKESISYYYEPADYYYE